MASAGLLTTRALAANSELTRCLDASTIIGAGGDVSDQELRAAQNACAQLKQLSTDRDTLARVKAAAENIDDEVARRAGRRPLTRRPNTRRPRLHRPRPEPVGRIPGHFGMRPVSAPSHREPPAKRKLDAAERRDAHLVALAMDHERACVPGMLLEPFGPRPAHIVQLRPVAIRQISMPQPLDPQKPACLQTDASRQEWLQSGCRWVYFPRERWLVPSPVTRRCRVRAGAR